MREILFRGQTRKFGEKVNIAGEKLPGNWVYGGIFMGTGDHSIIYGGEMKEEIKKNVVYSDTVGQFTGLKDKNGKKIFEGDVVRYSMREIGGKDSFATNPVIFAEGGFAVGCYFLNHWLWDGLDGNIRIDGIEVIGNIHDNPELLGGGTNE